MTAITPDPAALDAHAILDALCNWNDIEHRLDQAVERQRVGTGTRDPLLDEEFLMRAMRHPRQYYRLRAAELGTSFGGVASVALRDRYSRLRVLGATSRAAPPGCLDVASRDRVAAVRVAVAANARTPVETIVRLLDDRVAEVRLTAARRPRLPVAVLHTMAHHPDPAMRCIAAGHRIPVELLMRLAEDPSCEVTLMVASNPGTPAEVLRRLAERRADSQHGRLIASHPNTPVDVLDQLADLADLDVWTLLVSNRATRAATLERVPRGRLPQIHRQLARHPQASVALRRAIAGDYLDSSDIALRGIGLSLLFRGPVRVLPAGAGRVTSPPPTFERPVDVVAWLADGGDVSLTAAYARDASCPAWLSWFLHSQSKVSA